MAQIFRSLTACSLALFIGFTAAVSQSAAEVRVATVDVNRVLNESKEAQGIRKHLDGLQDAAKKKLETRRDALKQLSEKLKADKISEDSKEAESFRKQAREFDTMVKDTQEDLQKEFMKSNKGLTDKTLEAVKKYAAGKSIDLVLDKGQATRGPVLYAGPTFDITDDIIKEINN